MSHIWGGAMDESCHTYGGVLWMRRALPGMLNPVSGNAERERERESVCVCVGGWVGVGAA